MARPRTATLIPILALSLAMTVPGATMGADAAPAGECVDGLRDVTTRAGGTMLDVEMLPGGGAIAVGYGADSARTVTQTGRSAGDGWQFSMQSLGRVRDPVLVAVEVGAGGTPWSVGFGRVAGRLVPVAVHLVDDAWVDVSPSPPTGRSVVLTAIDISPGGRAWVAGYSAGTGGDASGIVFQRVDHGWVRHTLPTVAGDAKLTGIVVPSPGRVYAVGSVAQRQGIAPLILAYDGEAWRREPVHVDAPGVVLSAIEGTGDGLWATGWRMEAGSISPLLLRREDDGWRQQALPDGFGVIGSLLDLEQLDGGARWVVGTGYRQASVNLAPLVSSFTAGGWSPYVVPGRGGWYLSDIAGDPRADGWILGRATRNGPEQGHLLARLCEVSRATARTSRARIRENGAERARRGPIHTAADHELDVSRRHRALPGLADVPPLPSPVRSDRVRLRDVAAAVGLGGEGVTYGAWLADLDDDGRRDIVLSRHGQALGVFLRRDGGVYEELPGTGFPVSDRHGCAAGRIDAGPLGDIVCSTGGQTGSGLTTFELIIDPASGARADSGTERGISDPSARGRVVVAFDADQDRDLDLYLGNQDTRFDGLPSVDRLLLNDGSGSFTWAADSGLTGSYSVAHADARDIDRDGDADLVITLDRFAPRGPGVRIYRNDGGTFTQVGRSLGVTTIGDVDADIAQLGGSQRPDLVQLSEDRLRISLWKNGAYRSVFERRISDGHAFAIGDADGDGAKDIYLLLGRNARNTDDILLLNDGTGRRWTAVKVPRAPGGVAADVIAIDQDGDARSDFLVLNGAEPPGGPIQLFVSEHPDRASATVSPPGRGLVAVAPLRYRAVIHGGGRPSVGRPEVPGPRSRPV